MNCNEEKRINTILKKIKGIEKYCMDDEVYSIILDIKEICDELKENNL